MTVRTDDKEIVLKALLGDRRRPNVAPFMQKRIYLSPAPEPSDASPPDEDDDGHTES